MASAVLPCLACGQELKSALEAAAAPPAGATVFSTPGNYGSTVFDPGDESRLEINLCDACLVAAATQNRVHVVPRGTAGQPALWTIE